MLTRSSINDENWNLPPNVAFSFQRVQSLFPTSRLVHDPDRRHEFVKREQDIHAIEVTLENGEQRTVAQLLEDTFTDAIVVIKDGTIVAEQYFNGMTVDSHHLMNSVTKSVFGMLAGIAVERGELDPAEQVTHYLPDFANTAWEGASVRQVLDMTAGIHYEEAYENPETDFWQHARVFGWRPQLETTPGTVREYAKTLNEKAQGHGEVYTYRTICTDVLGMLIEAAMQRPLLELVQDELWSKLGCRHDAVIVNDATGFPFAGAGLSATARDLGCFGTMLLNNGTMDGEQVVPASWVRDTLDADAPTKRCFEKSSYSEIMPGWHYRNQCWIPASWGRDALLGLGIHGQTLLVDQANGVVIAKFSSQPEHDDEALYLASIAMVNAIAQELGK